MNNQLGENKMNRYIRMVKQFVLDPKVRFGYLTRAGFYNHMSDEEYLSRKYQLYFGQKLDLQNPQTFNEKMCIRDSPCRVPQHGVPYLRRL